MQRSCRPLQVCANFCREHVQQQRTCMEADPLDQARLLAGLGAFSSVGQFLPSAAGTPNERNKSHSPDSEDGSSTGGCHSGTSFGSSVIRLCVVGNTPWQS